MRILRIALLLLPLLANSHWGIAQKIKFKAVLNKSSVGINERFELSYELNAGTSDFTEPEFKNFTVVSGPNRSSSMKFENGVQTSSSAFKYLLKPKASGSFEVPRAEVIVDEKTYRSEKSSITVTSDVVKELHGFRSAEGDAFFTLELDKKSVGINEVVVAKYMLYNAFDKVDHIVDFKTLLPDEMWVTDLEMASGNKAEESRTIDGIEYEVFTIKTELWEPLRTGRISVEPVSISIQVSQKQNTDSKSSIFDMFSSQRLDTTLTLTSKRQSLDVLGNGKRTARNQFVELLNSESPPPVISETAHTIFAIDVSGSMMCRDIEPDRISAIKDLLNAFVKMNPNTELGFVLFNDSISKELAPISDFQKALGWVDAINIGYNEKRTSLGNVIFASTQRLKDYSGTRNLVIVSDGQNNIGPISPSMAAEAADRHGVDIYSICVGRNTKAPCLTLTEAEVKYATRPVEIDEAALKKVVTITGGRYFHLDDGGKTSEIVEALKSAISKN